jgi:hypothetical protein
LNISLSALEQLCHPIKSLLNGLPVVSDPLLEILQSISAKLALTHSTDLARVYKPRALEDADVLLDSGQGDAERLCEVADRLWTTAQSFEDLPPRWICQRCEGAVDRLILNHTVQYCARHHCCQVQRHLL